MEQDEMTPNPRLMTDDELLRAIRALQTIQERNPFASAKSAKARELCAACFVEADKRKLKGTC
jgi:hypothetical protein